MGTSLIPSENFGPKQAFCFPKICNLLELSCHVRTTCLVSPAPLFSHASKYLWLRTYLVPLYSLGAQLTPMAHPSCIIFPLLCPCFQKSVNKTICHHLSIVGNRDLTYCALFQGIVDLIFPTFSVRGIRKLQEIFFKIVLKIPGRRCFLY